MTIEILSSLIVIAALALVVWVFAADRWAEAATMTTALAALAIWLAVSIPVGILVGKCIAFGMGGDE